MSTIISAQNCPQCGAPVNLFKGKCSSCGTTLKTDWSNLQKVDGISLTNYPVGRSVCLDNMFLALAHTVCTGQNVTLNAMYEDNGNTNTIYLMVRDVLYGTLDMAGRITAYGGKKEIKYALSSSEWQYGLKFEFHLAVKGAWQDAGNYYVLTDMSHMHATNAYCQGEQELVKSGMVGTWATIIPMKATHFKRFNEERQRESEAAIQEKRRKQKLPFWNLSKYF